MAGVSIQWKHKINFNTILYEGKNDDATFNIETEKNAAHFSQIYINV